MDIVWIFLLIACTDGQLFSRYPWQSQSPYYSVSPQGGQPPQYGDAQPPQYGDAQPPQYGGSQPPQYGGSQPPGSQPPQYGGSQPPQYGGSQPPQYAPPATPLTCTEQTCKLPDCFCAGKEAPLGMEKDKIPQIVMFTFDDAINEQVNHYYKELFPPERVNPNGCPVSATFFLSHNWTDYGMVKELYLGGHEIASHSITHRMPQSWWTYATYDTLNRELAGQRDNIVQKASIPKGEIRGVRLPFLETGGDNLYKMLRDEGFEYDASFMTGPHPEGGLWPFTLDFPPKHPEICGNNNCPKMTWPGIWEVALNRWYGTDGRPCAMVDSCQTQPSHKGEALSYLWQNFNRQYYGNKSPVGVNMHAVWFQTQHHLDAMKEFISTLADMEDVYIVSVYQTIQWMRTPVPLDQAKDFEPWQKSCNGKRKLVKLVPQTKVPDVTTEVPIEKVETPTKEVEKEEENDVNPKIRKVVKVRNKIDENDVQKPSKEDENNQVIDRRRIFRNRAQAGIANQQSGRGISSSNVPQQNVVVTISGLLIVMVGVGGWQEWV